MLKHVNLFKEESRTLEMLLSLDSHLFGFLEQSLFLALSDLDSDTCSPYT